MNRILLSLMLVLGTASYGYLNAQTFFEDFQQGIPGTWTLYNEDGLTPNTNVSYVSDAWVADDDGAGDTFAVSTSWYTPAGQADDWLVSPPIALTTGEVLSWQARAPDASYPDGYQVLISTTGNSVLDFVAIDTILAENEAWTTRFFDLAAAGYQNQTVYIAFRNTSNDMFLLHIDDVEVSNIVDSDGALASVNLIEYSFVPKRQLQPYTFGAEIENVALGDVADAYVNLLIVDVNSQVLYNANSDTLPLLTVGQSGIVSFPGSFTPTDTGFYFLQYVLYNSSSDINPLNDTLTDYLVVTDTTYARDGGQATGGLGIGAGSSTQGSYLGQSYEILVPTVVTSVTVAFTNPTAADTASVSIFPIVNGLPSTTALAESEIFIFPDTTFQVIDFVFPSLVVLDVDTYAVVVREYFENVTVGTTTEKFTPGTTWINWPTIPTGTWTNSEVFGAQFARTFLIRPNFGPCPVTVDTAYVQQPTCPDALDGVVLIEATPNFGSLSFDWSNGDTDSIAEFLTGDVYTVTIEDGAGCQTIETYDLALVSPIDVNVTVTNASTATSTDGGVTTTVSGGTPPYTYEWEDGTTNSDLSGLAAGEYELTVTDANGCEVELTATVGSGVGIFNVANNLVAKVYPNPANDKVMVELTLDKTADVSIVVLNNLGQTIISQTETAVQVMNASINISALPAGIYLIQVSTDDASTTQKLIVE